MSNKIGDAVVYNVNKQGTIRQQRGYITDLEKQLEDHPVYYHVVLVQLAKRDLKEMMELRLVKK